MPPLREVPGHKSMLEEAKDADDPHAAVAKYTSNGQESPQLTKSAHTCHAMLLEKECGDLSGGNDEPPSRGVPTHPIGCNEINIADTPYLVLPVSNAADAPAEDAIFTWDTDPFLPARVAKIWELVQIGEDLTETEHKEVERLIEEFANCFVLSLSKVNLIPGAVHRLNIPQGTTFRMKIPQCPLNPDQQVFMETKVDEMLKAGVIRTAHPGEVKCVAPSVLAQKVHGNTGLSSKELKHKVNNECVKHGLPAAFNLPPCPPPSENTYTTTSPKKWCLCQDFGEINKFTPIAPVPHGDIHAKQLWLSGHRYIHVFDFTVGFYGIAIHPDSQPYITFYLEGRGHFAYERMPFGITGGPSEFGFVVG